MEKTEAEIEMAYKVARKLASSLLERLRSSHEHMLDFDDYVQEGVLAWLEGRPMYWAMVLAFKKAAKLSKYSYDVKGLHEPYTESIDDYAEDLHEDATEDTHLKVDAGKVLERIKQIPNEQVQFAIMGYFYFDMSLRDLAEVFGKSHEWVRTYLLEPEIRKLREEFA